MRRGPLLTIPPPQAITMRVETRRGPLLTIPPAPQAITMRVEMRRGPLLTIAPSGYNYEGRDEAWSFTNHCPLRL